MLSVKDVVVRFGGVVALDGPTFEVAPGEHALKANNTLVWKTVPFSAATGEHVQFEIANCATRFTLGFLSLIGVAPLYLKVERLPPT